MEAPGNSTRERYAAFQRGDVCGFAVRAHEREVLGALLDRGNCTPASAMGRGALFTFPLTPGTGVLREYRRGGIVGSVLREGALTNRPLHEWHVVNQLYDAGFPVPAPLGVVWRQRGALYTGAIASRYVEAANLVEYLKTPSAHAASVMERIGKLVRRMHELGVYHADLHAGNILVAAGGAADAAVHFVDFDNAHAGGVLDIDRARNLLRLRRSFLKRGLRLTDFERIVRGYGPIHVPHWLEAAYEWKGALSDVFARRAGNHVA